MSVSSRDDRRCRRHRRPGPAARIRKAAGSPRRGGHPRSTAVGRSGARSCTCSAAGERSHWHTFDAAEVWHYAAGDALELVGLGGGPAPVVRHRIGGGDPGRRPCRRRSSRRMPGSAARSLGAWTLVGCIVTPAFDFATFRLAPRGLGAARLTTRSVSRPRASPTASRTRSAARGTAPRRRPPDRGRPTPDHVPSASSSSATTGLIAVCQTTACDPYSRMVHSLSTTW